MTRLIFLIKPVPLKRNPLVVFLRFIYFYFNFRRFVFWGVGGEVGVIQFGVILVLIQSPISLLGKACKVMSTLQLCLNPTRVSQEEKAPA